MRGSPAVEAPGSPNLHALLSRLHAPEFAAEVVSPIIGPRVRRQLTREQRRAVYYYWGGIDWYTGLPVPFESMELDHLIPFSRGGSDAVENLRPTLGSWNRARGTDMRPVIDTALGATRGPDGMWVPDIDQVLVWHDGLLYTVPRFRAANMVRSGVYATLGAVVIDAAFQGFEVASGRRRGFDGNRLAEPAGQAAATAVVAYAARVAVRRALPQVGATVIGGTVSFAAAIVVGGIWEAGSQGVGVVRGQRDDWDFALIGKKAAAPVTDLVVLPVTVWKLGNELRPGRRKTRERQRAWRSQTFIPDLSTLSARLDAIPEPEPVTAPERRFVSVGFDATLRPRPSRRPRLAPAAAVLAPAFVAGFVPAAVVRVAERARATREFATRADRQREAVS